MIGGSFFIKVAYTNKYVYKKELFSMSEKDTAVKTEVDGAAHSQEEAVKANPDVAATSEHEPGSVEWYKEQNERLKAERDNYKTGLLNEKDKAKKQEAGAPVIDESKIEELVAKKVAETVGVISAEQVLDTYGFSAEKRAYIKTVYETRVAKGSDPATIKRAIEDAISIVERETLQKENSELKASQAAKAHGFANAAAGSHQGRKEDAPGFFSSKQEEELKKLGSKFGIELKPEDVAKNLRD